MGASKVYDMKLLTITLRADFGGGPEHIYQLLKNYSPEIDSYIAAPEDYPYWELYGKILGQGKMIRLPHRKINFMRLISLAKFCKTNKISLIHSHGKGAGIYSRPLGLITGIPVVHTFHGLHTGKYGGVKKAVYIWIEKILSLFTKTVIAVSNGERENLLLAAIAPERKVKTIENGIEVPAVINRVNNPDEFRVLVVSRFDYAKNSSLLLPIAKAVYDSNISSKKIFFDIVGEGEDKELLMELLKKEGLISSFVFYGFLRDMSKVYAKASCILSTSRWEGMSLALMEAMSIGVPAVVSNVTGNNNVVTHNENGLLYNLANPEECARQIVLLAGNETLLNSLSEKARETAVSKFDAKIMTKKTEAVYKSVLSL